MDLGSRNGTFSGEGVSFYPNEPYDVPAGSVIRVGRAEILVRIAAAEPKREPATGASRSPVAAGGSLPAQEKEPIPVLEISGVPERYRAAVREIKRQAHRELLARLNLKKLAVSGVSQEELARQAGAMIREILSQLTVPLPPELPMAVLEKELIQEAIGLGPLEYLLERDDITEIMVNGPDQVYVERGGVLYRTDTSFADNNQVLSAIERIVSPLGRRIDESSPMVDARLPDGSRVNAIIPPLSLVGPTITIRKFSKNPLQIDDLVRFGSISYEMADFLNICVKLRKNIIISGGTGSRSDPVRIGLCGHRPFSGGLRGGAQEYPDLGRYRIGKDDAAQRAELLSAEPGTDCHDRGCRGAAASSGASGTAGGASSECRGEGGGHHPRSGSQRAADASGSDCGRRMPRRRSAGHASGDEHRS